MTMIVFQIFQWWVKIELTDKLMKFDLQPGIIINHIYVHNNKKIELDILRDPDAITLADWLKTNLSIENITLIERNYYSLDPDILHARAKKILARYPELKAEWQAELLNLTGVLDRISFEKLLRSLSVAGFIEGENLSIKHIQLISSATVVTSKLVKQKLFNDIVGRISTVQLHFSVASREVTPTMQLILQQLYQDIQLLNHLADELELSFGLLIMGSSDNTGSKSTNNKLSQQRAQNTGNALKKLGLNEQQMYIMGLGQIDIAKVKNKARKVIFNVLYVKK